MTHLNWGALTAALAIVIAQGQLHAGDKPTAKSQPKFVAKTQAEEIEAVLPILQEINRRLTLSQLQLSPEALGLKAQIGRLTAQRDLLEGDIQEAASDLRRAEADHERLKSSVELLQGQSLRPEDRQRQEQTLNRSSARVVGRKGRLEKLQTHMSAIQLRTGELEAAYVQLLSTSLFEETEETGEPDRIDWWDKILAPASQNAPKSPEPTRSTAKPEAVSSSAKNGRK